MPFELDGNIKNDAGGGTDWASLYDVTGTAVPTPKSSLPTGFGPARFFRDFVPGKTSDDSTFTTGSKDTLNITPGWQCVTSHNVNDKVDVLNAYATVYVDPTNKDTIIYFGLEVASNEGTKDVAFWFLKDPTVGCVAGSKASDYTGNHSDGDLLIVAEYTSGGRVSNIRAYVWEGGANGALNQTPKVAGADCLVDGAGSGLCGRTNAGALLNPGGVPWLTQTKQSNPHDPAYTGSADLDSGEFFEGGINLTQNNIEACFNRYLADTRSSVSLTATIFDYVLGDFSSCRISANKTCSTGEVLRGESFKSKFNVAIKNEGTGPVYDVTFNETFPGLATSGETCTIVGSTGDSSAIGTDITDGKLVKVASTLAKGASVSVDIECTGPLNSFLDSIHAVAGTATGKSDVPSVDDAVTPKESLDANCPAAVLGDLEVQKICKGMVLLGDGATTPITLKANVQVTVKNKATSNERIDITSISDTKVSSFTQVVCGSNPPTPLSDLALSPGEQACFLGSYTPTSADLVNPPSNAAFADTVTVKGKGFLDGLTKSPPPAGATCYLCDFDLDGSPDVQDKFPNDPTQN